MPGHPRVALVPRGPKLYITTTRAMALLPHRHLDNSSGPGSAAWAAHRYNPAPGGPGLPAWLGTLPLLRVRSHPS
jgi:hypothetical protein